MPRHTRRQTRSARKPSRASRPAKKGSSMKTAYAGKYSFKPSGKKSKTVIKQESLGQQTESRVRLGPLGKPDSRAKFIKAVSVSSTYNKVREFSFASGATGVQSITSVPMAPQGDLRNIAESLQNYLATGSSSIGTSVNAPSRFLLEDLNEVYDFANRSSAPCTLRLYIVEAKRDTWYSTTSPMQYNSPNGAQVTWNGQPDDAMRAGIQAASDPFVSIPAQGDWLNPGMLPTHSPIFNQYFKIVRTEEIELAQGGVHQLTINQHFDKVCDASVYANTPLVGVRGITRFLFATVIGTPVIVTGTANMTTSEVEIGCIQTIQYKFTQASAPAKLAFQDPNPLALVAPAATYQINPGSGLAAPVVTA